MKIKLFIISFFLTSFIFLQSATAQGIFEKETTPHSNVESISTKGWGDWGDPNGGDGTETDQDGEAGDESPIGEGLIILTALSAGYILVKKYLSKKNYEI